VFPSFMDKDHVALVYAIVTTLSARKSDSIFPYHLSLNNSGNKYCREAAPAAGHDHKPLSYKNLLISRLPGISSVYIFWVMVFLGTLGFRLDTAKGQD
jgi:hypothetical protein